MADPKPTRMNYFDHQYLRKEDFDAEQQYHIAMRRLHNRSLHTWGVAYGLDLTCERSETKVRINIGVAVDKDGQEIWLTEDHTEDLSKYKDKTVYVTIAYGQKETLPVSSGGVTGSPRIEETPIIHCTEKPDDPGKTLILGRVTVDKEGAVSSDDGEGDYVRRAAGVTAGALEVRTLRLSAVLPPGEWPALSCSEANRVDLTGSLSVSGDLNVGTARKKGKLIVSGDTELGGALTVSGDVSIGGTSAQKGNLEVSGNTTLGGALTVSGNVGIGTSKPETTLEIQGTVKALGRKTIKTDKSWKEQVLCTETASTDGFVVVIARMGKPDVWCFCVQGFVGDIPYASAANVFEGTNWGDQSNSFTMPVLKGEGWSVKGKIIGTKQPKAQEKWPVDIYWYPLGQG
jgi:hypothetical protein